MEAAFRSTSLVLGSAVHSTVAWWHGERIHGRTPCLTKALDMFTADLLAETADANVRWKTATFDSLETEGRELLRTYFAQYGDLPVASVETPFQVDLEDPESGEIVGRPFRGYFDLVLRDRTVVELKTSSKGWIEFDLGRHLQLGGYAFAWNRLHGGPSALDVHVLVKLKREPRIETYRIARGASSTRWWFEAARAIEAAIEEGHFPPSPSMFCRECEYETACAAWTGEAVETRESRRLPVISYAALMADTAHVPSTETAPLGPGNHPFPTP